MRFLRSIACIALAMCASVMMTMPSIAAVPIDPGISAVASSHEVYPAPVIQDVDHVALTCEAPAITASVSVRSTPVARDAHIANIGGGSASFIDLRRRC